MQNPLKVQVYGILLVATPLYKPAAFSDILKGKGD
jgi:hypothetical protein